MAFIQRKKEKKQMHAFHKILLDIPNGGALCIEDLTQSTLDEGVPVGFSNADGLYHVIKSAAIAATAGTDATTYVVEKGHNFKVGDVVMLKTSSKAYAITAISTNGANANTDNIEVGTSLGAAAIGDVLLHASKAGASGSDFKYKPVGLTYYSTDVYPNVTIGIATAGQIWQSKCPLLGASVRAALPMIQVI